MTTMLEIFLSPENWVALFTLVALEIVLGVDNIIFIAIIVGRLPEGSREKARKIGLALAMVSRLGLLFSLTWIMGLTEPLFSLFELTLSGRDLILIVGGLFLLGKSVHEIHNSLETSESKEEGGQTRKGMLAILLQITVIDIVFSLDSVITAVGLVDHLVIMVMAIVISVGVMMLAAKPVADFVDKNPTIKMLALSFLILIGFTLVSEGFGVHIPKGYAYFAMAFSVCVEMLNIRLRKKTQTVKLIKHPPN